MKHLWILCIALFCVLSGNAQQPVLVNCNYTVETLNTPGGIPFFAVKDAAGDARSGQVRFEAGSPGWSYTWTHDGTEYTAGTYAADSSSFVFPLQGNGVYSVRAEKEGEESLASGDFRVFYVHVPEFELNIVEETRYDCEGIELRVDGFQPVFFLYGEDIRYYGGRDVEYLVSGRSVPITYPDYQENWKVFQTVDDQDARYTLTITDKFGFAWTSTEVEYVSVIPKAEMSFKLLNTVKVDGYGTDMGQAPLDVEFTNKSVNADSYEWYLYKDTADLKEKLPNLDDSLMDNRRRTESEFTFTYEHPGQYAVRLKAINTAGPNHCWDTTELKIIKVIQSLVNVPNVFTPNGDGINDVFRVQMLSATSFHAVIINRWGRKVYEWSDPGGGWDGKINGTDASPGTYYYIVTARGLEKYNPPKYVKKGALLLVR